MAWAIAKVEGTDYDASSLKSGKAGNVYEYKAVRSFKTREAARAYKAARKNPKAYMIVNTLDRTICR